MSIFESKVIINKPVSEIYTFLADMNNHQQLMPENITGWSSTKDRAEFMIQNMGNLSLKIFEKAPDSVITIVPAQQAPFDIEIRWKMLPLAENTTEAILTISAQLNMMMKMLASGPLQKLADYETKQLKTIV